MSDGNYLLQDPYPISIAHKLYLKYSRRLKIYVNGMVNCTRVISWFSPGEYTMHWGCSYKLDNEGQAHFALSASDFLKVDLNISQMCFLIMEFNLELLRIVIVIVKGLQHLWFVCNCQWDFLTALINVSDVWISLAFLFALCFVWHTFQLQSTHKQFEQFTLQEPSHIFQKGQKVPDTFSLLFIVTCAKVPRYLAAQSWLDRE